MLHNTEIEQEVSNTVHQLPDLLTGTPETTEVDDTETTTVLESDSISHLETNECLHAIMPTISLPHMDDDTLQVETAATGTETCSQPSECSAMPFNPCTFNLQIGPTITLPSDATALEFFHLVFGEDTCNLIASETNEYARQNPPGDGYNWVDTNKEEIQQFLGVLIAMGIHRLPQVEDYWSTNPLLGAPGIISGMPIKRFKVLLRHLHLNDNTTAVPRGEPNFDKLHKLRPLISIIRKNSLKLNNPGRQLSIDEAMVGYKGRSTLKQYMPNKPTKRGYKVWCICDAQTGYILDFNIYTGASETTEYGLGEKVILTLANPFLEKGFFLYFDNYFSSVRIAEVLLSKRTYCCATARTNRKNWPKVELDGARLNKTLKRGEHKSVIVSNGQVECLMWKDNKVVSLINTITSPSLQTTVNRRSKDGSRAPIACPQSVKDYNTYMGGVDLADARRKSYSCSRRSRKGWHRLFYFLVDISMVNAYLLHQRNPNSPKQRMKDFILELATELLTAHSSREKKGRRSLDAPPSRRFNEAHFPDHLSKARQCVICSKDSTRKRTSYGCRSCNAEDPVPLCITPCYRIFHMKNSPSD
jgi:hypothetical protein